MIDLFDETVLEFLSKIKECKNLQKYFVGFDSLSNEFFYISRVDCDTIIINNNKWNEYLCLWDYERDCLDYKTIQWINRFVEMKDFIKIDILGDKESCVNLIKSLEKANMKDSLKHNFEQAGLI